MLSPRYAPTPMKTRTVRAGSGEDWLTIGSLSRAVGIPVATLRTWERRYRFPVPSRRPSGHRLYPASAVAHLHAIKRLLELGRRPVEVMGLSLPKLEALIANEVAKTPRPGRQAEPRRAPEAGPATEPVAAGRPATEGSREILDACLAAVRRYDLATFADLLRAGWARLGPVAFLDDVAGPMMVVLGEAWTRGEMDIRHEHLAAARLGEFLRKVRRPYDEAANGPVIAVATPPGDRHELGLLMASLVFALKGYRVLYLGPDTPAAQITALAREIPLGGVALSISATSHRSAPAVLRELEAELPPGLVIWTGGAGAPPSGPRAVRVRDMRELFDRLPSPRP